MKFGDNLKKLRKMNKLSQEQLAEKVNVSRQSVSKWECADAYPEMNNLLELCNIFHCRINDLVNDSIIDIDFLDDDTKKSIVKLQKKEQSKIKRLSKAIVVIAKILNIVCKIALPVILLVIIVTPFFFKNIVVSNNEIRWNGSNNFSIKNDNKKVVLKYKDSIIAKEDVDVSYKYIDILTNNSKGLVVFYIEIGFISVFVNLLLLIYIFTYLEKLFINIYQGDTPFTLENTSYIRKMAYLMIVVCVLPNIGGLVFSKLLNADLGIDFEMFDLVQVLFLFSISYIFKYGYQLQLDSSGIMYGNDDE